MTDIVERLRDDDFPHERPAYIGTIAHDAADEIERLRADLNQAWKALL